MKSNKCSHLLILSVAALLSFFFVSCSKDEEEESDMQENTENLSNQDPEGTIVLNMISGTDGNYYKIADMGEIHVDAANNFRGKNVNYVLEFVNLGKVEGLGKITQIPESGWSESAAIVPGTGYVMRYTPNQSINGIIQYARIYVVDYLSTATTDEFGITTGSNSGAIIKYQAPFKQPIVNLFQAGSGTEDDPYQINTAEQLKSISKALDAHFILTNDITLTESANGNGWDPIGKAESPFTGTFDGQGHIIKKMWMKRPTTSYVGLFGYIQDASIYGIIVETDDYGIRGKSYTGGICGYAQNSSISQCAVKGYLSGNDYVGSICGYCDNSIISECFSEGYILSNSYAGGIAGYSYYSSFSDCYSMDNLNGNMCYGISYRGEILRCYYAGEVNASDLFGCSGTNTYYDKTVIGSTSLADTQNARTTQQMMTKSNYEGWDFTKTWKITEGKSYPTLRWYKK